MATTTAFKTGVMEDVMALGDEDQPTTLASYDPLLQLVSTTCTTTLRPAAFFPAFSGVLTLAYLGFPDALRTLKQNINNILPLGKESPGSRWPKTSLGCLKEGVRLKPEQLKKLNDICTEMSGQFQHPQSRRSQAVLVDQLEVVLYQCRCLERKITKQVMQMKPEVDTSEPNQDEKERVRAILGEVDAPDYWYHATRDGNREMHYRGVALGATLIHELACFTGRAQALATTPISKVSSTTTLPLAAAADTTTTTTTAAPDTAAAADSAAGATSTSAPAQAAQPTTSSWLRGIRQGSGTARGGDVKAFSSALPGLIRGFKQRVDRELPGLYTWFAEDSLHVTIRAILG